VECVLEETYRFHEAFVRLGTTEAEKPQSGRSKAFTAEAGNATVRVGLFQQEHSQAVGGEAETLAPGAQVREDVESAGGWMNRNSFDAAEVFDEEFDFGAETLHVFGACGEVVFECSLGRFLHKRRNARQRGVEEFAKDMDDRWGSDGEAATPAAHAVTFGEGVGGDGTGLQLGNLQGREVLPVPDHVAVGFVGEEPDGGIVEEVSEGTEVIGGDDTAGGVVGRIEEDGFGAGMFAEKAGQVGGVRAKVAFRSQRGEDRDGSATENVGDIGGEGGLEHEDGVAGFQKGFAEEGLEDFGTGTDGDVFCGEVQAEFLVERAGNGGAELWQTQRGAVVGQIGVQGSVGSGQGTGRGRKRTIANLQMDDIFAGSLETAGHGQHIEGGLGRQTGGKGGERGTHGETFLRG